MSERKNTLYVGNLTYKVNETMLRDIFEKNGISVQNTTIVKDKHTDKSKGFAFVDVVSKADTQKAISCLNDKDLDGRLMSVSQAKARKEHQRFSGSKGSRGSKPFNW